MLELKMLHYFDAAFRAPSLRDAAAKLGIAVSSLSESMNALEEELGMMLFERAGRGLRPTQASYWLFREIFKILNIEGFTTNYARRGRTSFRTISIHLHTSFSIGALPVAIARAIRAMAHAAPEVYFAINWDDEVYQLPHAPPLPADQPVIQIVYKDESESETICPDYGKMHIIGSDALMLLGRPSLMSASDASLEPIHIPHIPILSHYAPERFPKSGNRFSDKKLRSKTQDLEPFVELSETKTALMAKLKRRSDLKNIKDHSLAGPVELIQALHLHDRHAPVIVPASSLLGRFKSIQNFAQPLAPPFALKLVAIMTGHDPAGCSFIGRLRAAFASSQEKLRAQPLITARQLHYFKLVKEAGSIKAGASAASIAHSAVTAQLAKLQSKIHQPLFERRAKHLYLTEAGRRFSQAGEMLENSLGKLRLTRPQATMVAGNRIELGILPAIGPNSLLIAKVTEAVEIWRMSHPEERLRISEASHNSLQTGIRRGTLHLGVVAVKSRHLPRFDIGATEPLGLVYTSQLNLCPQNGTISYDELAAIPLVLPTKQFGLRQLIDSASHSSRIFLRSVIEVESLSMCVAMVRRGCIATILPRSDIQTELESDELCFSLIENPTIIRRLQVIYSSDRTLTAQERDLVALLRIHLRAIAC